ncbi:SRPBCC family protein [Psychroserpens luteolus]|uniref:SRPBCC family protein n=1 Tax=Psychroserpens luteolus TaxID=2855840 RepID=UPI001E5DF20A|nr:SRPBCC family protein [Psychroserpens luteolus]MCD2259327.1 SRPBCC family protein [Psychroserpens luteolus]
MKFSCEIIINAPIDHTAAVFENPDNLKHFQDGFISKELISGTEGSEGAISKMIYKKLELKETIITNNLPAEFKALYEHKHMTNTMSVQFKALADDKTQYISEIDYTKFNGLFIKLMATLFPGMFKKQVYKWMTQFKTYTESLLD